MIPIIDDFVQRFNLTDFIVVADSGLMSENNVNLLEAAGYKYILGARIRSESQKVKKWLLDIGREDGNCAEYVKRAGQQRIVSYSEARAKKNAHKRRAVSLFKYGLDYIFQSLVNHTNRYRIDVFKFLSDT